MVGEKSVYIVIFLFIIYVAPNTGFLQAHL